MAFDLNAALRENRKFLAGAVVGLALFLVARTAIGAFLAPDLDESRGLVAQVSSKSKGNYFNAANLKTAQEQESKLAASVKALRERLAFVPRPEFELKDGGATPANQYLDISSRMRERRLEEARASGIELVDSVGIPDRPPTRTDEIRRTLRGLDLVDRVVDMAVRAGVRSIDRLVIAADRPRTDGSSDTTVAEEIRVEIACVATSRSLSSLLEASQATKPPIPIVGFDAAAIQGGAGGGPDGQSLLNVAITFTALTLREESAGGGR